MERNRAESVDAAREKWWIGIRDNEAQEVRSRTRAISRLRNVYIAPASKRRWDPALRNKSFAEAESRLRGKNFLKYAGNEIFRRGYDRGRQYLRSRQPNG